MGKMVGQASPSGLEDHSLRLRHCPAAETYRESWSGAQLRIDPKITPGYENDDDDDAYYQLLT